MKVCSDAQGLGHVLGSKGGDNVKSNIWFCGLALCGPSSGLAVVVGALAPHLRMHAGRQRTDYIGEFRGGASRLETLMGTNTMRAS